MDILQMSIQAGLLIIAIVVIRAIALNKLPKTTFLILWGVALIRLLVPFSFSSRFSAYSFVDNAFDRVSTNVMPTPATPPLPNNQIIGGVLDAPAQTIGQQANAIDPLTVAWLIGILVAVIFFTVLFWRNYREFRFAWIIRENKLIDEWKNDHKLLRPFSVLQSDRLTTPITVGYLRPRIILPKSMNLEDEQLLRYVLTHEYYHIRRFDTVLKLLATIALCIHWFNPLVWVMVILLNRDLEITCDEMVVRHFGADTKTAYAYSLIGMAEQRSKLTPFYSGFSKNAAEERITAIMKIKKHSLIAVFISIMVVAGTTTVFATSAAVQSINLLTPNVNSIFTADENDKLLSLQFDGYQNMSIAEYRAKVIDVLENSDGYSGLILERMWENEDFEKIRYTDKAASFYFDILMPILYSWQGRFFCYPNSAHTTQGNGIILNYWLFDEEELTVREYVQAMQGFTSDLYLLLESKGAVDFEDESNTAIREEIEQLKGNWELTSMRFDIEYGYFSITPFGISNEA
jgi:beta-lactamase regulating signal transducer with metallopeptidase domain